jgi:hypothetical protein
MRRPCVVHVYECVTRRRLRCDLILSTQVAVQPSTDVASVHISSAEN